MFRLFLNSVVIVLGVLVIPTVHSSEIRHDDASEKRGQQTLADVIKELNVLKTKIMQLEISYLKLLRARDGRDGKDGKPGPRGHRGPRGPPGHNGGGVEYIRWGKTSCPYGANKVYKGYVGGQYYTNHGGGSNYICLTEFPKYLKYKPGLQGGATVYGTEYDLHFFDPFNRRNLYNHDVPCVACHVQTRSSKLMIPGTYQCPSGWTTEYYGYLMTERFNHGHSAEYICVDTDAEPVPRGRADLNGALLYPVEGVCGSLPCSPYVHGRELTCVVCTK